MELFPELLEDSWASLTLAKNSSIRSRESRDWLNTSSLSPISAHSFKMLFPTLSPTAFSRCSFQGWSKKKITLDFGVNSTQMGPSFNISFELWKFGDFLWGNGNEMITFMLLLICCRSESIPWSFSPNMNIIILFPFPSRLPRRKSLNSKSIKLTLKDGPDWALSGVDH